MKFRTYASISILLILTGCNPNNPTPNSSISASWSATINGSNYSYTCSYTNGVASSNNLPGTCTYGTPSIILSKGVAAGTTGDEITISIEKQQLAVGTYNITSSTGTNPGMSIVKNFATIGHSYYPNTNVTLNITEFPSSVGGLVKGNFNGVIGTTMFGTATMPISGQFQVVRLF
jgi:hypothetical protein